MKIGRLAWMGAGLLLAGVAGAAVVNRRKGVRELPAAPKATPEHEALREIMQRTVAYNDALYERVVMLEKTEDSALRPQVVSEITNQNQVDRVAINELRAALQSRLAEQGRTFADVDGFADVISEYRGVTLRQQKRHLEVFQRVRKMANVPETPELHAYVKLGFKEDEQRWADTDMQLMKAANEQRELMLRAGRVLDSITDAESATAAPAELNALGDRYIELTGIIRLYRDDDPKGAEQAVNELRKMYSGLLPMLKSHAARLRENTFYDCAGLRSVVERMLPQED